MATAKRSRKTAATARPDVDPDAVRQLHDDFLEMDTSGSSSNDVVQMLDDWFTGHGYPTVIYRR